jgi:hypothetical protein
VFRKSIFIDGCGGEMLPLAYRAAYHTSGTMNQNIVRHTENRTGHPQLELDRYTGLQWLVQLKQDAAG